MFRPACLATLTALLLVSGTPSLAQGTAVDSLLQQARYWLDHGRQDRAIQAYRRVLAIDPDNAEARRGLNTVRQPPRPTSTPPAKAAQPSATPTPPPSPPPRTTGGAPAPSQPVRQVPQWSAADDRAAGYRYLEKGELERAAQQFLTAISRNRSDAEALGGLGIVRLRQNRFAEARDLLTRASSLGKPAQWAEALQSARYFAGLADARDARAAGRIADAQQQAEVLVRSGYQPNTPAMMLLAEVYEKQGRYADAADILGQAGSSDAEVQKRLRSRAARNQALQAAQTGNDREAEGAFISGMALDPQDPWIRYEFARYLNRKGRVGEVDAQVNSIASIGTPDALYAAALLSEQQGRPGQAQAFIDRIPAEQRTGAVNSFSRGLGIDAQIARAKDLAAQGQAAQGIAELRRFAGEPGLDAGNKVKLAGALLDLGDQQGAAIAARDALASGGLTDARSYEPIIRVLAKAGMDAEAQLALEHASSLAGTSMDGQQTIDRLSAILAAARADRLRLEGQYAAAFDVLRAAWATAPGNSDILLQLALLYQSGSMPAQASQTFQLYLNNNPDDVGALLGLARTSAAAGDNALAASALSRAMKVAPGNYEVYLAAADVERARGNERRALAYLQQARAIYAQQSGLALGGVTAANPFAMGATGGNPFAGPAQAPQPVNPFELSSGTRLPGRPAAAVPVAGWSGGVPVQSVPGASLPYAPGFPEARAPLPQSVATAGSPVLEQIDQQIRSLAGESGPRAGLDVGYRARSGETGLSKLSELTAKAEASTDVGSGRIKAGADIVVVDAGRPTGSALARFGRNATPEAQAIVDKVPARLAAAETQHEAGVAPYIEYKDNLIEGRVGTTPLGFEKNDVTFRAEVHPRLSSQMTGRAWAERRPVKDSVVSYAGTRDPVSGEFWGQVMRTGGGAALSYDEDGSGLYGEGSYGSFRGHNVRNNDNIEINMGGYLLLNRGPRSTFTAGVNVNYQDYDNNQDFFTFGHGGYFSPQSFIAIAFPLRYVFSDDRLELQARVAPGYQSYKQQAAPVYPNDPVAQGQLDALKDLNSDVRSRYDSISKTGLAISGDVVANYRLSPRTSLTGTMSYDSFGNYNEFKSLIGIQQSLGDNVTSP